VGGVANFAGREHFGGEFCGVVGDFVEVAVLGVEVAALFAVVALALILGFAEGGEEWFPGAGVRVGGFAVRKEGGVGEEGFVHADFPDCGDWVRERVRRGERGGIG